MLMAKVVYSDLAVSPPSLSLFLTLHSLSQLYTVNSSKPRLHSFFDLIFIFLSDGL
jgi:hypothetical protein